MGKKKPAAVLEFSCLTNYNKKIRVVKQIDRKTYLVRTMNPKQSLSCASMDSSRHLRNVCWNIIYRAWRWHLRQTTTTWWASSAFICFMSSYNRRAPRRFCSTLYTHSPLYNRVSIQKTIGSTLERLDVEAFIKLLQALSLIPTYSTPRWVPTMPLRARRHAARQGMCAGMWLSMVAIEVPGLLSRLCVENSCLVELGIDFTFIPWLDWVQVRV